LKRAIQSIVNDAYDYHSGRQDGRFKVNLNNGMVIAAGFTSFANRLKLHLSNPIKSVGLEYEKTPYIICALMRNIANSLASEVIRTAKLRVKSPTPAPC
jgi:hypothetical protein